MFPGGMDPRQMKMAMKRMGIQQYDLDAEEVIIRLKDKEIVITNPSVAQVNMMGQKSYQISGVEEERPRSDVSTDADIDEEDIKTVAESAEVSLDEAEAAIRKHNGDLAAAIMGLKQ
jgi:nascent polypeptide-associated complex subunit alpha